MVSTTNFAQNAATDAVSPYHAPGASHDDETKFASSAAAPGSPSREEDPIDEESSEGQPLLSPEPIYRVPSNTPFVPSSVRLPAIPVFSGLDNDLPDIPELDLSFTTFWLDLPPDGTTLGFPSRTHGRDNEEDEDEDEFAAANRSFSSRFAELSFLSDNTESAETSYDISFGPYTPSPSRGASFRGGEGSFGTGVGTWHHGRGGQERGVGLGILGLGPDFDGRAWERSEDAVQPLDELNEARDEKWSATRECDDLAFNGNVGASSPSLGLPEELSFTSAGHILTSIPECDSWAEIQGANSRPPSESPPDTPEDVDLMTFSFPALPSPPTAGPAVRPNLKRASSLPKSATRRESAFFLPHTQSFAPPLPPGLHHTGVGDDHAGRLATASAASLRMRSASCSSQPSHGDLDSTPGDEVEGKCKGRMHVPADVGRTFELCLPDTSAHLAGGAKNEGGGSGGKRSAHRRWRL